MSKEVKRFTIGTFHATIVSAGSECVLASDYDGLLAERDRLREALDTLCKLDENKVDVDQAWQWALSAARDALQGEQQ